MTSIATRTPRETFDEFVRAYNAHDRDATHACFSKSFVRYGLTTGWQPMGWESYKDIFDPFLVAFPDFAWEVLNVVTGEDWVSAEIIETGTFEAPYAYRSDIIIEPTGKSYRSRYAIFAKVADGLIVDYRFYEDATWPLQLDIDINELLKGMAT